MQRWNQPKGLLLDYGGTLVEEVGFDTRAGMEFLLARASHRPARASFEAVFARALRVSAEVADRRDRFLIETPWPSLTRLIYEYFGIQFAQPIAELELPYWDAAIATRPMAGAREALTAFHRAGVPMAVVSNASFGHAVIRHELAKHGLAEHLAFVMVSADYAVRKPHVLLFETASSKLGVDPRDIWFVGDRLDTDVAGARSAGMTPVWLRPSHAEPAHDATLTVTSWSELLEQFQRTTS